MTLSPANLIPAAEPTFYFIGVTTAKSSIMKVFPRWAEYLGLGQVPIVGIDCRVHDDPENYRKVVRFIREDPHSLGGLVTTHKIDLLRSCRDLFDDLDRYADLLGEVSSISKSAGKLVGHAKDPITSGLALEAFLPPDYWKETGAEMLLLGAGGSSLALTMYLMEQEKGAPCPSRIVVTNRSLPRLEEMKAFHARSNTFIHFEYVHAPHPEINDEVVASLRPGSLVINATGLGKDALGSPLTDHVSFPQNGIIWDFNYRGELIFLDQAHATRKEHNLRMEDGWIYFIHGWTRVIAEVFHIDIPTSGPAFDELSQIAQVSR
jgi:shikimate 5-dehydrogenase